MKKFFKVFLCFLLSAITVFSSLPAPALAADDATVVTDVLHVGYRYKNSSGTHAVDDHLIPITDEYSWVDVIPSFCSGYPSKRFRLISFRTDDFQLDGNGTITYKISLASYPAIDYTVLASIYVGGKLVDSNCSYQVNGKNITITVVTTDTYKNAKAHVCFELTNPKYDTNYEDSALTLTVKSDSLQPYLTTKSDSFFDGIFGFLTERFDSIDDWFSALRDSIKGISTSINEYIQKVIDKFKDITDSIKQNISLMTSDIQGFFQSLKNHLSDLVVKIKTFFAELGEQITAFAMSVKEWFADLFSKLGDWFASVGQWFKDLWSNISNKFVEIKTDIKDWFESLFVVGENFWAEYRDNFNVFMSEHFGFLYQTMDIFSTILTRFKELLVGNGSGGVHIPKVAIPAKVLGQEYIIVKPKTFMFQNTIREDDTGKLDYILTTLRVINSAFIIMLLINRGRKLFDMIITQGEGVEE